MIQRELERRAQLIRLEVEIAREARLKVEKHASFIEEQQCLQQAQQETQLAKDRQYLEDLKIPELLQNIIEEEHLDGAHVLWLTAPYGARISLVWDITYAPPFHRDQVDYWDGTYLPQVDRLSGYEFKHIDIMGSFGQQRKLILLETTSTIIQRGSTAPSARTRTVLSEAFLPTRTSLEEDITSAYLDYPKGPFYKSYYRGWPFGEWVPEAEVIRDRIILEGPTPTEVWEEKRKLHEERKQQAKKFHEESGVGKLLYERGKTIQAEHHYDGNHEPWYIGSPHPGSKHSDNYWESISWGEYFIGKTHSGGGLGQAVHVQKTYGRKYIAIETHLDGTIIVHGSNVSSISEVRLGPLLLRKGVSGIQGFTTLPLEVWRNNQNVLKEALERAYNSPENYAYTRTSSLPGIGNA